MSLDVEPPSGDLVAIDDPALIGMLCEGLRGENHIRLVRSDRALTDCRPLSPVSPQTVRQIGEEPDGPIDKRRFRANIYLDLASDHGFAEDELVGRKLRLGSRAEIVLLERDPRCKMISLDPDTGEHNPEVFRKVVQAHGTYAGYIAPFWSREFYHGVICSMSRSGNVWDNAAMESLFSSLKTERTARKMYRSHDEAKADVFDYIERFYNPKRRHSTIEYLSPMEFERQAGFA